MKSSYKKEIVMGCCMMAIGFIVLGERSRSGVSPASYSESYIWWEETILPKTVFEQWNELEKKIEEIRDKLQKLNKDGKMDSKIGKEYQKQIHDLENNQVTPLLAKQGINYESSHPSYASKEQLVGPFCPWKIIRPLEEAEGIPDYKDKVAVVGFLSGELRGKIPPIGTLQTENASAEFRRIVDWRDDSINVFELRKQYVNEVARPLELTQEQIDNTISQTSIEDVYYKQLLKGRLPFPKRVPEKTQRQIRLHQPGEIGHGELIVGENRALKAMIEFTLWGVIICGLLFIVFALAEYRKKV